MNTTDHPPAGEPDDSGQEVWRLRLYIVGGARNSVLALSRLRTILEERVPGQYELEVIDILEDPRRALTDGILLTPTLLKFAPLPAARLVGNLSESERVTWALGLRAPDAEPKTGA